MSEKTKKFTASVQKFESTYLNCYIFIGPSVGEELKDFYGKTVEVTMRIIEPKDAEEQK